jgi:adenosylcobinamide-GDP ribazoletransferase
MLRPLAIAIVLLTRFPVAQYGSGDPRAVGRSVLWYPAVGLLVGLVLVGVCLLVQSAPAMVGAALATLAWCGMTGGLHLDGLSDSADALIGSHGDAARALEIMKDPSAGPMGVVAVCIVLMVKFAALTAHISAETWWPIVAAPVLGRAALIALLLDTPYVRPGGLGAGLAMHLPRGSGRVVLVAALAAAVIAGGVAFVIGAVLAFLLLRKLMMRTIGGTTGDTAGALVEVTEAAALVAATLW